ncbi:hypothetical protein ACQUJT_20015 [Ralstonia pseudosolanacearum]
MDHQPTDGAYKDLEHRYTQRRLAMDVENTKQKQADQHGGGVFAIEARSGQAGSNGDAAEDREQLRSGGQAQSSAVHRGVSDAGQTTTGELLRFWKAEQTAFGILLVAYACLMMLAPALARHSDEINQLACTALDLLAGLRTGLVVFGSGCMAAALLIAVFGRDGTSSGSNACRTESAEDDKANS